MPKRKSQDELDAIELRDLLQEMADLLLVGTEKERIALKEKVEMVLKKHASH